MRLELDSLAHRYGDELAIDDVSFGIEEGELVALLGPSGCGKTTVVQSIAGHVQPTAGRVRLRGTDVTDRPPESRRVSVVFQRSTLFPHMTVAENVAYGLGAPHHGTDRRDAIVDDYLRLLEMQSQRDAYPSALSGGQRRRVELARALAPQPDLLVLDEPLSGLDQTLREHVRDEIARIQRETGVTTLYVTHDQQMALALADRLVVMNDGTIAGSGTPRRLYTAPPTPFVASFLGRSNTFSALVVEQCPPTIDVGGTELVVGGSRGDVPAGSTVTCHVRPADLSLESTADTGSGPGVRADVKRVVDVGTHYEVTVEIATGEEFLVTCTETPPAVGKSVRLDLSGQRITVFGSDQSAL